MDLQSEKKSVGAAYYNQIEKAVDKGIPQENLQTIIDEYTQLQLELQKKEIKWTDIETLSDLVAALEREVTQYNGQA